MGPVALVSLVAHFASLYRFDKQLYSLKDLGWSYRFRWLKKSKTPEVRGKTI